MIQDDYFLKFEDRTPPPPLEYNPWREALWQFLATIALVIGAWYIIWRWTGSLNPDAMWFAVPLVVAETCAFIGMVLFVFNLWKDDPIKIGEPPVRLGDVVMEHPEADRPLVVDVMFATYDEDPELVRLGILDAKKMTYPHPIDVHVHILDDGRRPEMQAVTESEGANYISRATNEGFKAGNLRNAMEQTHGDFLVICDADTRPFPTMLEHTLGYFRDPKMAWVQTPQWFYDLPEGERLPQKLGRRFGDRGQAFGTWIERLFGPVRVGEDPFVNDPKMFYDVIQRRRNRANASFCCGAGSIHRREAVMMAALRSFGAKVEKRTWDVEEVVTVSSKERELAPDLMEAIKTEAAATEALTPYKFHVSEDIYTSIVLHSDRESGWKSKMHPIVESKMLSPQDLLTWTVQRFKYAGGSLDILVNDNPIFRKGLTFGQRMMYTTTFYSYLAPLWNIIFLLAPAIYLFTGVSPVAAYSAEFFFHLIPFLVTLELAIMIGTWGIAGYAPKASYLAFFPLGLKAIFTVARGEKITFKVTPKVRQSGNFLGLVWPQIGVVVLTGLGAIYAIGALISGATDHSASGVIANIMWGINNCLAMAGMIAAAVWQPSKTEKES
ncbi:cellulose synthase [Loktanella sp. D2R18]|uniref:glycosyltransferase family 2 protein n=1 Tax=Rhodobacterales TaxID=204455 RepID=UPI000DEA88DC|nr:MULTISPECIES: cellulose synthase catalytic subunit [Rhodobacterales]MDO6591888.1 cellulose synthase catalytic subunit [Yoonia sp. 1_MG-2023]RBW42682.1 cellulose synthase [Loktanella sp. D2R18]